MSETKFKQTETGPIPEDWEVKRLGELLSVGSGRSYKHLSVGDVPVYGTGGLMCFVDDYLYDGETVCIGRKGTINVPYYHEGKIWTVDTLFFTHSFNGLIPKYAYYLFLTIDWLSKNEATGVPSLSRSNIEQTKVDVPPLAEQEQIASALSSVDELIASLDKLIAKTRDIKQGAMQRLLNSHTECAEFSKLCSFVRGVTYNKSQERDADSDGYRVLRANNITLENNALNFDDIKAIDKTVSVRQEQFLHQGDILMCAGSGSKEHVGKVAYIDKDMDYCFGGFMGVVRVNERIKSKYLFYVFTSRTFKEYLKQAVACCTINNINSSLMNDFPIPVVSLAEQERIANVLTSLDDTLEGLEAKRQKYEFVKAGMMQQLLTGAIRLN